MTFNRAAFVFVIATALAIGVAASSNAATVCGCKSNSSGRVNKITAGATPTCPSSRTLVCWNETALPGDSSVSAFAATLTPVPTGPTYFSVPFDMEYFDTDTMHDNVTANHLFVARQNGKYLVTASVVFAANPTGLRELLIEDIAGGRIFGQVIAAATPTQETVITTSAIVDLLALQTIRLVVTHNAGVNVDIGRRLLQMKRLD